MSKKVKIALIVICIAALAYVAYRFFLKDKLATPAEPQRQLGVAETKVKPLAGDNDSFPLDAGSRGPNVVYLQRALNYIRPQNQLVEDGVFMDRTRAALLLTLPAHLSLLPLTQDRFNKIIALGNQKKLA